MCKNTFVIAGWKSGGEIRGKRPARKRGKRIGDTVNETQMEETAVRSLGAFLWKNGRKKKGGKRGHAWIRKELKVRGHRRCKAGYTKRGNGG